MNERISTGTLARAAAICLLATAAAPSDPHAAIVYVQDGRLMHVEAATPDAGLVQEGEFPAAPLANFMRNLDVQQFGQCTNQGGTMIIFFASTATFQDSWILSDRMHGEASASASLPANEPEECGPGASTGAARSLFQVTFSTDVDYEFFLDSPYIQSNTEIQLLRETGGLPVVLHSFVGTGMVSHNEVHGPGTYTLLALAEADEPFESSYFNVDLRMEEAAPQAAAGRASGLLASTAGENLQLAWQPSCTPDDDDYAIYSGTLGQFTSHSQLQCSTLGSTSATLPMPSGSRYYLIVPLDGSSEGSYGLKGDGAERPIGASTCGSQAIAASCP